MVNTRPNILIVHNYYQIPGGEDTVVLNEMNMLQKYGHKVFLYSRRNDDIGQMNIFRKLFLPLTTIFSLRTYLEVIKIIRDNSIDIVHVHNTLVLVSPSVYYASYRCRVPIVQTIHNFRMICPAGTFFRDGHICEDCVNQGLHCAVKFKCYRNSKLQSLLVVILLVVHRITGIYKELNYICLTEFNKDKLINSKVIQPEKVFIKANFAYSGGLILPNNMRKRQILYVGRLDIQKGVNLLLKAWQKMGVEAPKLIILGTGPMEDWCKQFIFDNNITNIELVGFVDTADVRCYMKESLALILPSQLYEGFPMSLVESFSNGTPVLGSDIGNVGSLIKDGINGFHFKHDSIESIIESIKQILHVGIEDSVYKSYLSNYTLEKNYQILLDIYYQCLGIDKHRSDLS